MYITEDYNGRVCSTHDTKYIEHFIRQAQWKEDNLVTTKYRVSWGEYASLRENVPYVKVHRYNPKNLYQKLNG